MNTEELIGKELREGYTTGATATAAMKAAILAIRGEFPKQVTVLSPQRTEIIIPVKDASAKGNVGTATVLKDAGDDLDCTNGTPIIVTVEITDRPGMELKAGKVSASLHARGCKFRSESLRSIPDRKLCSVMYMKI